MKRKHFILVILIIAAGVTTFLSACDKSNVQTAGDGNDSNKASVDVEIHSRRVTGKEKGLKEQYIEARDEYVKADEKLKEIAARHPLFLCSGSVEERGEDWIRLWGTAFSHSAGMSHPAQQTEPTNIKINNASGKLVYNSYMGYHYYSHQETGKNQLGNPVPVYIFKSSVKEVEDAKRRARESYAEVVKAESLLASYVQVEFEKKTAAEPENPDPYIDYGDALYDLSEVIYDFSDEDEEGTDYTKLAIREYKKALELDPENVRGLITIAQTYYNRVEFKEAVVYYERIARIDPGLLSGLENLPDFFKLSALFNEGYYKEAKKILQPFIEDGISRNEYRYIWTLIEGDDYYNKGVRASEEGNHRKAIQCYDLALEKLEKAAAYADDLDKLLAEDRINKDKALYHLCRGKALVELGQYELAGQEYKLAIDFQPDNPGVYLEKAKLNYLRGYTNYAAMDIKKALQIDPAYREVISSDSTLGDFINSLALDSEIEMDRFCVNAFDLHLVLKRDGTIWQWKESRPYQEGVGTSEVELVLIDDGGNWTAITAAPGGFAALNNDGSLWQFKEGQNFKKRKLDYGSDWRDISGNGLTVAALKEDGTLWAWDDQDIEQISTDKDWKEISTGGGHLLALKEDGTLWAWGNNSRGQLGINRLGDYDFVEELTQVGIDDDWVDISAGISHSAALKRDGTLWVWGSNEDYILDVDGGTYVDRPMQLGSDSDWKSVSAGFNYTVALKEGGTLWGWGRNDFGQLSFERDIGPDSYSIHLMQLTEEGVAAAGQAGEWGTLALANDGSLYIWGFKTDFTADKIYLYDTFKILNINQ